MITFRTTDGNQTTWTQAGPLTPTGHVDLGPVQASHLTLGHCVAALTEFIEAEQMGVEGLACRQLRPSPLCVAAILQAVGKALLALLSSWRSSKLGDDLRPGSLTPASSAHLAELFWERRRPCWWSWSVGGPQPFLQVPWLLIYSLPAGLPLTHSGTPVVPTASAEGFGAPPHSPVKSYCHTQGQRGLEHRVGL